MTAISRPAAPCDPARYSASTAPPGPRDVSLRRTRVDGIRRMRSPGVAQRISTSVGETGTSDTCPIRTSSGTGDRDRHHFRSRKVDTHGNDQQIVSRERRARDPFARRRRIHADLHAVALQPIQQRPRDDARHAPAPSERGEAGAERRHGIEPGGALAAGKQVLLDLPGVRFRDCLYPVVEQIVVGHRSVASWGH